MSKPKKRPCRVHKTPDREVCAEPDWQRKCKVCGGRPVVCCTGLCGPCTFGEAETAGWLHDIFARTDTLSARLTEAHAEIYALRRERDLLLAALGERVEMSLERDLPSHGLRFTGTIIIAENLLSAHNDKIAFAEMVAVELSRLLLEKLVEGSPDMLTDSMIPLRVALLPRVQLEAIK